MFLPRLSGRSSMRKPSNRSRTRFLTVEALEDRCVLSGGLSAALVADIVPGADSSNPHHLTNVNGALYFGAKDPTGGVGLWKSNGTAGGTVFIKNVGSAGAVASEFTPLGQHVYFSANGSLWKTDGTTKGTVTLTGGAPQDLTAMNGKLFFASWGGTYGVELWVSNGKSSGTSLLKDIYPGGYWRTDRGCSPNEKGGCKVWVPYHSSPAELTYLNGMLLFAATDGSNGRELWRSDGTSAGTTLVKDIVSGWGSSNPESLTVVNGVVYFAAAGGLWKSDGTNAGTTLVKNVAAANLTNVNGTLYFAGTDASGGAELWKSDGTDVGTVRVKDISPGIAGSSPQNLTNVNGTLFFNADDGMNGRELWKSDGTAAGTVLVLDIHPGTGSSSPTNLTNVNGLLYFAANDGVSGNELWQSNGTAAGTAMVQDIYVGSGSSDPGFLTSMNNRLFFAATDAQRGRELWDPPPVNPSSGSYLYVAEYDNHQILRYDAFTGAFVDQFVPKHSAGLKEPQFLVLGPHDQDLYVGSGHFGGPLKAVLRYDGETGRPVGDGEFTESDRLDSVHGVIFGPDGNLYVADRVGTFGQPQGGRILRFDGLSGAYLDEFVPTGSGGLRHPFGIIFAPDATGDLDLYVADGPGNVLRYDGATGTFVEEFVRLGSGGLDLPLGLAVGPDGYLYVADVGFRNHAPKVLRYQGPTGDAPGKFVDVFVPPGSGGLLQVQAAIFGPDGNGDGYQDLYVSNSEPTGIGQDKAKNGNVKRYDGVTGAFIDTFIPRGRGKLNHPTGLTFTETDPVTLAYRAGGSITAAASRSAPAGRSLTTELTAGSDYLLVTNVEKHNVLRYDAATGNFVDEFVTRKSGALNFAWSAVIGPHDGDLYVSSGHRHSKGEGTTKAVLRYDGQSGRFVEEFVDQGQMYLVHGVTFGPDGNIYVGEKKVLTPGEPHQLGGRIMRFDGRTGTFMDEFVSLDSGGLRHPAAHVFGPDGRGGLDLYVSDEGPARILRYDGDTGAFVQEFVTSGSGGLSLPNGVIFGPDGNMYVASFGSGSILRYQGPSGASPGAFMDTFVASGSGGMLSPTGILFGPDGNRDGHQDLYVANVHPTNVQGKLGNVRRYDGITGAYIDTFIPAKSGGLDDPSLMTFTRTDPVTLAYRNAPAGRSATFPPDQPVEKPGRKPRTEVGRRDIGEGERAQRNNRVVQLGLRSAQVQLSSAPTDLVLNDSTAGTVDRIVALLHP